ncbi:hypothetical protein CCP3SC1AL1_140020 [Gammaproteobacteria bacterium]
MQTDIVRVSVIFVSLVLFGGISGCAADQASRDQSRQESSGADRSRQEGCPGNQHPVKRDGRIVCVSNK